MPHTSRLSIVDIAAKLKEIYLHDATEGYAQGELALDILSGSVNCDSPYPELHLELHEWSATTACFLMLFGDNPKQQQEIASEMVRRANEI